MDGISLDAFAAFSRILADDPLQGHFPMDVRVISYAHPYDCPEQDVCETMKLYVVVIGDGEAPDYRMFDAGNAVSWKFLKWVEKPTKFYDDDRDAFVMEMEKTVRCDPPRCTKESTQNLIVRGRASLATFRWLADNSE